MLKALMCGQLEPYFINDVRLFDSFFFGSLILYVEINELISKRIDRLFEEEKMR